MLARSIVGLEVVLKTAEEYRSHAAECRALAASARNQQERDQLVRMAEAWDYFALECERRPKAAPAELGVPTARNLTGRYSG